MAPGPGRCARSAGRRPRRTRHSPTRIAGCDGPSALEADQENHPAQLMPRPAVKATAELYQSGYYVQSARLVDCHALRCRKAGFLCKNQIGGHVLENCSDAGSAYGLVIEYGGERARVEGFVSDGATRRALQMVGNNAEVGVEVGNFAGSGRPVQLGITERLEFVDAPGHAADLARYRALGYAMKGNRIGIVTDRPMETVEVHPPSVNSVNMDGVAAEHYPPRPLPEE